MSLQEGAAWAKSLQITRWLVSSRCKPGLGMSATLTACGPAHWQATLVAAGWLRGEHTSESLGALVIAMKPWRWTLWCLRMLADLDLVASLLAVCAAAATCAASGSVFHFSKLAATSQSRALQVLRTAHSCGVAKVALPQQISAEPHSL
ncbi:unnamed protein product [Effrenium voratum]|nr:unnamed protein product [Effrenium voratum]